MERRGNTRQWSLLIGLICLLLQFFFFLSNSADHNGRNSEKFISPELTPAPTVYELKQNQQVVMSNGIVNVTLSTPAGLVTGISYNGIDNLLQTHNQADNRGYWDVVWNKPGSTTSMDKLSGTRFKIIMQNEYQAELSFARTWNVSLTQNVPLNVDKRFVMLRGSPGFYSYTILEHLQGWPDLNIQEARLVFKLQQKKFHFMAMSEERQRIMPAEADRITGQVLDYPEAVLLTQPTNPDLKGEVDDKYMYSCENKDNKVHGWISNDPPVGFWMITPSNEFRTGGPLKQDLTSHVGPTVLSMFVSTHYAGEDLAMKLRNGEPWKKVLGPVFIHLNSDASASQNPSILWNDAKQRMFKETANWPYTFPLSKDFVHSDQRGTLSGQLLVQDWYINKNPTPASSAYVGLAPPGKAGSWQRESKGYQFWTQADTNGNFAIKGVVPGTYSLFAWVPGFIGDYIYNSNVTIRPGSNIKLGGLEYKPPRNGATMWEIGVPDRSAAEFFVPNPSPKFKTHSYRINIDKFRQYGLWARYADLYPHNDLQYTVGVSNYKTNWFFAHVTRSIGNRVYRATTWQIIFDLRNVNKAGKYTLQLAIASANDADLQVRFNNPQVEPAHFRTGRIGKDNAIARHGIHGLYWLYSIGVPGSRLVNGRNTIFLTQSSNAGPFRGIMYINKVSVPASFAYVGLAAPGEGDHSREKTRVINSGPKRTPNGLS
ncbi:unnamed protein product [Ilex paraguariensis]|uniref:rhamnogalacturonan endolyase n=1 Tax=Ilex paraguariensis TaxID=185542 RepID=A0ABC8SFN9_9AQUA